MKVRIEGAAYAEVGPVEVKPDEKWEGTVSFTINRVGNKQKVEFLLYKVGESEPCVRPLRLWIDVKE